MCTWASNSIPSLKFEAAASSVIRKASHRIYNFSVIRKDVSVAMTIIVFKSMVLPFFNYPNFLFNSCNETTKKKLQRLQNRALSIVLKRGHRVSTHDLHVDTCMMKLEDQCKFDIDICGNVTKAPVFCQSISDAPSTRARSAPLINVGIPNTKYLKSLHYLGTQLWNDLLPENRRIDDFNFLKPLSVSHSLNSTIYVK